MRIIRHAAVMFFGLSLSIAASAQQPVKIGVLMPTSGVLAALAAEQINGMQIALDEFGGMVAGRKIEMIVEDDESKPNVGLTKARKLILSDKVDFLTGIVGSDVALAVRPFAEGNKIPIVIANAGANALTGENCSPWLFRVSFSHAQMVNKFGAYLVKRGIKKAYAIAADFVSPREMVAAFRKGFVAAGGTMVGEVYSPYGQTNDFGPYLSQARAANPDAIFGVYYGSEAILFVKQYQSFGLKDKYKLVSTMGLTPQMLRKPQGDAAADILGSLNYVPELDTPANKAFQAAYQKRYGTLGAEFAVMGYDAMRFILEALKSLGGNTSDKAAIAAAIRKVSYNGPRGPMSIDPKNNALTQNIYMTETVKQGDQVVFRVLDTFPGVPDPAEGCRMAK